MRSKPTARLARRFVVFAILIAVGATFAAAGSQARVVAQDDILAGIDPSLTIGASLNFDNVSIPTDFFGPGSLPPTGLTILAGDPVDPLLHGLTDTVIQRLADASVPVGGSATVPIEMVELSLVSVSPVAVGFGDGTTQDWLLRIGLSGNSSSTGVMEISRGDEQGGGLLF